MTQAELAAKLNFHQSYISMVIKGDRPITDAFRWRWQEAFGARALRVLNGETPDAKP